MLKKPLAKPCLDHPFALLFFLFLHVTMEALLREILSDPICVPWLPKYPPQMTQVRRQSPPFIPPTLCFPNAYFSLDPFISYLQTNPSYLLLHVLAHVLYI